MFKRQQKKKNTGWVEFSSNFKLGFLEILKDHMWT
jgi:hypothetical protein